MQIRTFDKNGIDFIALEQDGTLLFFVLEAVGVEQTNTLDEAIDKFVNDDLDVDEG